MTPPVFDTRKASMPTTIPHRIFFMSRFPLRRSTPHAATRHSKVKTEPLDETMGSPPPAPLLRGDDQDSVQTDRVRCRPALRSRRRRRVGARKACLLVLLLWPLQPVARPRCIRATMHPAWTALLLGRICPIWSFVAPCHAGASPLSAPRGVSSRTASDRRAPVRVESQEPPSRPTGRRQVVRERPRLRWNRSRRRDSNVAERSHGVPRTGPLSITRRR